MVKPVCFMVMPYGVKPTGVAQPPEVDFDDLWDNVLLPVIEDLGFEPVRADQDLGAMIIDEMIERLAISDLVVADISTPNANVYYEIGVRHAAKKSHCVIIAAEWSKPAFDLAQIRHARYPLPGKTLDARQADIARMKLSNAIADMIEGTSPVYEAVPDFPTAAADRTGSFRKTVEQIALFQAAVTAVRKLPKPLRAGRAMEICERYGDAPMPSIAVELLALLRDATDWQTMLAYAETLPEGIRDLPIVQEQRNLARSKSGDDHEAVDGLLALMAMHGETSERLGLLGGRYKRLYRKAQEEGRGDEAAAFLDEAIRAYQRGMELDLNDYYPTSNLPRLLRIRRRDENDELLARRAAQVTIAAAERARSRNPNDPWAAQALLGAAVDERDVATTRRILLEIKRAGPLPSWMSETTLADLRASVATIEDPAARAELETLIASLGS